jgi:hypothetical protein
MCTFFCWISDSDGVRLDSDNESILHHQNVNNGIDGIQTDLAMTGGIDFVKQVSQLISPNYMYCIIETQRKS